MTQENLPEPVRDLKRHLRAAAKRFRSLRELAREASLSADTVARAINGPDVPSETTLRKILDTCGMPPLKDGRYDNKWEYLVGAAVKSEQRSTRTVRKRPSALIAKNEGPAALIRPSGIHKQERVASRVGSIMVIGGDTGDTMYADYENTALAHFCADLGACIARAGAELIICSPFSDSADIHAFLGYVRSGVGGAVRFHSPAHPNVAHAMDRLLAMVGDLASTRVMRFNYPGPEDQESWGISWTLCQLQALDQADAVVSIGGRTSKTASLLLHLAEARQIPLVPYEFLGGASRRAYERRDWARLFPDFDPTVLREQNSASRAVEIINHIVTAQLRAAKGQISSAGTIFISRSKHDANFATVLAEYLASCGLIALLGDHEVREDRMVQSAIADAMVAADVFVVLWSSSYALSKYCYDELEFALQRQVSSRSAIWLINLDGSDVIPSAARRLLQIQARTSQELISVIGDLLHTP